MAQTEHITDIVIEKSQTLVDVHTHLTDELFTQNIEDVIQKAFENNVKVALVLPTKNAEFAPVLELYRRFPHFVLPCLGIHPVQNTDEIDEQGWNIRRSVTLEDYEGVEAAVEENIDVIGAIGEIGLDFTPRFCKTAEDKESQKLVLRKQVELALKHDLPVNVHSRSAGKHTIDLLKEMGAQNVLFHAFDGRASTALEGASCGFYFSITASICRDPQIQKLVKNLPLDRLLLETDSPAIAPVKGELNVPSNVVISRDFIAKIKNLEVDHVTAVTTENAMKLFPKLRPMLRL